MAVGARGAVWNFPTQPSHVFTEKRLKKVETSQQIITVVIAIEV